MALRIPVISSIIAFTFLVGCGAKDHMDVSISGANGEKINVKSEGEQGNLSISGANGEKFKVDTKNGEMSMSGTDSNGAKTSATMGGATTITEADLGVPFYPGSTEKPSEQMKVVTDTEKDFMSTRTSSDEPSKVIDFYKEKVKGITSSITNSPDTTLGICSGTLESGAKFTLTAERKKDSKETEIKIGIGITLKK
ncbi:MAG: hypothetical protein WCI55_14420 [Armatimonadota bacterium]